jgi:acyl-CoA thioester hydrolase
MNHECSLTVRTYECDTYGHVNNAVYLHYLEFARHEYLTFIGFDYRAVIASGYGLYVARIEIDYKKPAFAGENLVIHSWSMKKGAVSGVMGQKILRDVDVIVDAKVTWAFVDSAGMPCRIPAEWDLPGLKPRTEPR